MKAFGIFAGIILLFSFLISLHFMTQAAPQQMVKGISDEAATPTQIVSPTSTPIPTMTPTPTPTSKIKPKPTLEPTLIPTATSTPSATLPPIYQSQDTPSSQPEGATAKCEDGTYSFDRQIQNACQKHGGVAQWNY